MTEMNRVNEPGAIRSLTLMCNCCRQAVLVVEQGILERVAIIICQQCVAHMTIINILGVCPYRVREGT